MAKKRERDVEQMKVDLLKDILIVELGRASVPQQEIRRIVGCDIGRVNRIVKHIKKEK